MQGNNLSSLAGLPPCHLLLYLDASHNELTTLPASLLSPLLTCLSLRSNRYSLLCYYPLPWLLYWSLKLPFAALAAKHAARILSIKNWRQSFESCRARKLFLVKLLLPNETILCFSHCRLGGMGQLPWLPSLQALYLQDNGISQLQGIHGAPNITLLNLASNPIADWQALGPVSFMQALRRFDLSGCPIEQTEG